MQNSWQNSSKTLTANIKAGGCAAKVSALELHGLLQGLLQKASLAQSDKLLTSLENFEDAAVYKISEEIAIVQTVDFFPPMLDDPFLYGRIAANNALSDVYAMGGTPILALNILCFPTCDFPLELVSRIVEGGFFQLQQAGAFLAGGHTIQSTDPIYGLAVMGIVDPRAMLTNCGARAGDAIIQCKEIGTGVGLLGLKAHSLSPAAENALTENLTRLNAETLKIASAFPINAATDVTGFGLIGHVHEMAKASKLVACLNAPAIRFLPETVVLAEQGFVPAGAYANRKSYEQLVIGNEDVEEKIMDLLYDPQTAGGLLLSVKETDAEPLCEALHQRQIQASVIGRFADAESAKGLAGTVRVTGNEKRD